MEPNTMKKPLASQDATFPEDHDAVIDPEGMANGPVTSAPDNMTSPALMPNIRRR